MKILNDIHFAEYGENPQIVIKSPGRFHLIGEHSWFFKDKTMSAAVNLPVYVAFSKREDNFFHFYFYQAKDRKKTSVSALKYKKEDRWANAVKSMIYGFISGGFVLCGLNITIYSEILPSAGFGITSAIKAAVVFGVKNLLNLNCSDAELLRVVERGNKKFLKSENYLANNFVSLFAKKGNFLITDHYKKTWDYVPFNFEDKKIFLIDAKVPRIDVWDRNSIHEPQNALLLGDLRENKSNVYGGWQYIESQTDINEELSAANEDLKRRLNAIINEHRDLISAYEGAEKGDFFKFARSVNHSHQTMQEEFDISCPEIDWILKRVKELEPNLDFVRNPVTCGRITGKGFGRCLYAIMRESDIENFKKKIAEFEKIFGFHPDIYQVEPSDGVSVVRD